MASLSASQSIVVTVNAGQNLVILQGADGTVVANGVTRSFTSSGATFNWPVTTSVDINVSSGSMSYSVNPVSNNALWNPAGTALLDPTKSDGSTISLGGGGLSTGRTITASTTAALTDANTLITFSHATVAGVISIDKDANIAWPLMAVIGNYQKLAAACTFAAVGGSGVNIRGTPSGLLNAIQHVGTDEWVYL